MNPIILFSRFLTKNIPNNISLRVYIVSVFIIASLIIYVVSCHERKALVGHRQQYKHPKRRKQKMKHVEFI